MNKLIFIGTLFISACRAAYPGIPNYGHPQLSEAHQNQHFAPPAPVGPSGNVIDTPEVAQAKQEFLQEYARVAERAHNADKGAHGAYPGEAQPSFGASYASPAPFRGHYQQPSYAGPSNIYQSEESSPYGAPADLAAYSGHYESPQIQGSRSFGPIHSAPRNYIHAKENFVPAPLASDGRVIDTPEVAALKDLRLKELADAEARAYKYAGPEDYNGDQQQYNGAPIESAGGYHGNFGASGPIGRAFQNPGAYSPQHFAGSAPFNGKYQSQIYQPQSYQSQHQVGQY